MKKVILDMNVPQSKAEVHTYLKEQMHFPEYYGANLDALYDELTSLTSPTAVGFFLPCPDLGDMDIDLLVYIDRVKDVFLDAEQDNPELAVIVGELPEGGFEEWEAPDEDWDNWEDPSPEWKDEEEDDWDDGEEPEEDEEPGRDGEDEEDAGSREDEEGEADEAAPGEEDDEDGEDEEDDPEGNGDWDDWDDEEDEWDNGPKGRA